MSSIRSRLTLWLLGGLAILCIAASVGIYLAIRQSLLKTLDAELAVDARIVRFAARSSSAKNDEAAQSPPTGNAGNGGGPRRLQDRMPAYDDPDGDAFFQIWSSDGTPLEKSASLGTFTLLPPAQNIDTDPVFGNATLDDGRKVRTMSFRVAGGAKGRGKGKGRRGSEATVTVLAKQTDAIDASLTSLIRRLTVVGIAVALAAILLVRLVVRHGLKPLRELSTQTESINADSLDARFDGGNAPVELQPVYTHLNALIDRLETGFDRERRFSSDLAHEMRTPVAELKMLSEVALKWPDQDNAETHSATLEIADQLSSMIETLLSLARWESGEKSPVTETVDLATTVRECWPKFAAKAGEKNITVGHDLDSDQPQWETDPAMLRHILNNLFSNAAEYTPKDGQISIVTLSDGVEISNTTTGLKPSDLDHFFDRYWRGDRSRTDANHTGLGLSLSQACANALQLQLTATLQGPMLAIRLTQDATAA